VCPALAPQPSTLHLRLKFPTTNCCGALASAATARCGWCGMFLDNTARSKSFLGPASSKTSRMSASSCHVPRGHSLAIPSLPSLQLGRACLPCSG
jgi:hypothetical protein